MRRTAKALLIALVSLIGSIGLVMGAAFSAAFAFGATALIVPGTGTHNVLTNTPYREHAADRYIDPSGVACSSTDGCAINGVDYPATFFPLVIFEGWCPGLQCDTWNESVNTGVTNLDTAMAPFKVPGNGEDVIIFGYSQGGAVVSREMYNLAGLDQGIKDHISVVTIGNINNPLGLFSRLGFLPTIPGLDISFGPQLPTDIGIKSTNYSFEYDPVGDAPAYWGNPLAMLNAVAAFEYVHGYYLVPNDNGDDAMPYGYDDISLKAAIAAAPHRTSANGQATFVLIPQRGPLPIFQPFVDLGKSTGTSALVNPVVALLNPVTKLLVNLGYDRGADPSVPQYLSILPFNPFAINPITFPLQFAQAIVQGVVDAINVAGGGSLYPPAATTPVPNTQQIQAVSAFSRMAAATPVAKTGTEGEQDHVVADLMSHQTDEVAADLGAGDQAGADQSGADQSGADQTGADQNAGGQSVDQDAADKAAAEKEAAAKAAEKEAADKAAAEKEAAAKAAEKDAAAKAAERAAAEKAKQDEADKAKQEEADKAKAAADKLKSDAAENAKAANGATTGDANTGATDTPAADAAGTTDNAAA